MLWERKLARPRRIASRDSEHSRIPAPLVWTVASVELGEARIILFYFYSEKNNTVYCENSGRGDPRKVLTPPYNKRVSAVLRWTVAGVELGVRRICNYRQNMDNL